MILNYQQAGRRQHYEKKHRNKYLSTNGDMSK